MNNLSIDFYDESHAAVSLAWPPGTAQSNHAEARRFADALLFAAYTIRQMRNLGTCASTESLVSELSSWEPRPIRGEPTDPGYEHEALMAFPSHVMYLAAASMGMSTDHVEKRFGAPIWLVPHRGPGRRRFVGRLHFASPNQPVFTLHAKGFGLGLPLGWKVPFYATDSVLIFLAHLVNSNLAAPSYLDALRQLARECASAYRSGFISSIGVAGTMRQERVALELVAKHYPVDLGSYTSCGRLTTRWS